MSAPATRKRRPERRDELLAAAARLFHERGYHDTGIDDIGEAAGITGPGVYRHFRNKEEILETLATEYGAPALAQAKRIIEEAATPEDALAALADLHVSTVLAHPSVSAVALFEHRILRPETRAQLERMERKYVEEWVHTLHQVRPELDDSTARLMVHGALGLGLSICSFNSGLADDVVRERLTTMIVLALTADR